MRGACRRHITQDIGSHAPWRDAVRCGRRALESPRELEREQSVRQFRVSVAATLPALAGQVIELNSARRCIPFVSTAHRDYPALRSGFHEIEHAMGQYEMAEMIDDEVLLE